MKQIKIHGIEMTDMGTTNNTHGMHLIYFYGKDPLDVRSIVQAIKDGDIHCLYLNPSAPCTEFEFYGVMGTEEQYREFYAGQKASIIAKCLIEYFGGRVKFTADQLDPDEVASVKDRAEANYEDWWNEEL